MWEKLTPLSKALVAVALATIVGGAVYKFSPGLIVSESKKLLKLDISTEEVNNITKSEELPLPSTSISDKVSSEPLVKIGGYAWNAQSGIIVANGGKKTASGSQMEAQGVNLEIIRQDWLTELRNLHLKFVEEFDKGKAFPEQGIFAVMIMGDGAPFYISSVQQALNDKYGKNKYNLQVVGAVGLSYGEDKLIGPFAWKRNPKEMKGALISAVIGDGDWVTAVNYAFLNGIKVNPDPTTYDSEALNIIASANDDYIESAKELIKSQKEGWTVPLKEVSNGKLTGKTINKRVDGCATWTPGDKMVFDALNGYTDIISTKEFNNQMATTVIAVKEWAEKNRPIVKKILTASYIASNQMKQYDSWRKRASKAVASTYEMENADYWYSMFQGKSGEKDGVRFNMGGSRVFNLSDAKQYYGITDGINRYKAVYDQVSQYLKELNPAGFNENVKRIIPYDEAVNLSYVTDISGIESGVAYDTNYSKEAKNVIASGEWNINFDTGKASLKPEAVELVNTVYNLLVQAEDSKLEIIGHTDNQGSAKNNLALSESRAESVKSILIKKGIQSKRFQKVEGRGQEEPIADNSTEKGKAKNRRVVISLLK
jgi:OmpA-OmpF porin, OOP family